LVSSATTVPAAALFDDSNGFFTAAGTVVAEETKCGSS